MRRFLSCGPDQRWCGGIPAKSTTSPSIDKAVIDMVGNTVRLLACFIQRFDMHADRTELAHVMEELMTNLYRDGIPLGSR